MQKNWRTFVTCREKSLCCKGSLYLPVQAFLRELASVDCLFGKIDAVQARRHVYTYHVSSGWSVAKEWQFEVYSKQQMSPSLPFSFDLLPVSLNRLMLTSDFLFLFSRALAAIKLLVCSCHFLFFFCTFLCVSDTSLQPSTYSHLLQANISCFSAAPNLCTDFLNSASCCEACRKKAE